ncbi:MAG TPA: hypothetical protein VJT80_19765 [Steroidobacteraceae bacterium]|nr:hypothetical protein [Steroidobacteraceae bacterium]
MKKLCLLTISVLVSAGALGAEQFNGTQPMDCEPTAGHDCLPTEQTCKPLKPEPGKKLNLHIDVEKMSMKTPYRNDALPIQSFSFNSKSLVLQGTSLELVWSATVHRTTGRLTMAIADREGAYIVFGQCKVTAAAAPPPK